MKSDTLYNDALCMAIKVKFLTNSEELFQYAHALYSAMMWGKGINEKHEVIQEKDNLVK